MILYHRTDSDSAEAIIREGFRDGIDTYMTNNTYQGVWLSDTPLDESESGGAFGDTLLKVTVKLSSGELAKFEWKQERMGYREFLIPADLVNAKSTVQIIDRRDEIPDWARDYRKSEK